MKEPTLILIVLPLFPSQKGEKEDKKEHTNCCWFVVVIGE